MAITISLVENERELSRFVAEYINQAAGFRCVSTHPSAEEALAELPRHRPDVVLMDINLGGMSGIECARRLHELTPALHILMLTAYEDSNLIFEASAAGATGYLLKRTPPPQIPDAITEVMAGGSPMSAAIARKVVLSFQDAGGKSWRCGPRRPFQLARLCPRSQDRRQQWLARSSNR